VEIQAEHEAIQDSVRRILADNLRVSVDLDESKAGCTVRVLAHLLEAYSPDDKDAIVRGAYGSHAGLYGYVRRRIAQTYRTIFTSAPTLRFAEAIVECRHGVRHVVIGGPGSGDHATTLYTATLAGEVAKRIDWSKVTEQEICGKWTVVTDIIPQTQFQFAYR
jgi:hypothetical protein